MLAGVFASDRLRRARWRTSTIARQLGIQALCAGIAIAWSVGVSWVLLRGLAATIGIRAEEGDEQKGLDLSLHNESGYNL